MRAKRVRQKKGHGALWSIIYIDLMTQIMAFFVILWAIEHGTKATTTAGIGTGFGIGMGDQTVRMVDLPGDVLFASGKTELAAEGKAAIEKLFGDKTAGVLDFDQGGLAQRKLVIHGHTDNVGPKDKNFELGFKRAWAVYQALRAYSPEVPDHVVLCTHADNTPQQELPAIEGKLSDDQKAELEAARQKNRRITIEDLVVSPPVVQK